MLYRNVGCGNPILSGTQHGAWDGATRREAVATGVAAKETRPFLDVTLAQILGDAQLA
jgi:hypothetical protein